MDFIIGALGCGLYVIVVRFLFVSSNNVVFMMMKRPVIWVGTAFLIGVAASFLARVMGMDSALISLSLILVVLFQYWGLLARRGASDEERRAEREMKSAFWDELGIANAALKTHLGAVALAVGGYLPLIQTCELSGRCSYLI